MATPTPMAWSFIGASVGIAPSGLDAALSDQLRGSRPNGRATNWEVACGPVACALPAIIRSPAGNASRSVFYWGCAHSENAGQLTAPPQCSEYREDARQGVDRRS